MYTNYIFRCRCTLVDYEGNLPSSAVEAIRKARENRHKVYISTGRSKAEVKAAADFITDDVENDGLYKAFEKLNLI